MAYILLASVLGEWLPPKMVEKKYQAWRLLYGLVALLCLRSFLPFVGNTIVFAFVFLTTGAFLRAVKKQGFSKTK